MDRVAPGAQVTGKTAHCRHRSADHYWRFESFESGTARV
jgi:hypothetical protein